MSEQAEGALLAGLLPRTSIVVGVSAGDWEAAVLSANEILVRSGAVERAYGGAMIEMINREGPYVVIAPGVALPHARPSALVHRTELSMLLLREPVVFGHPENDPVTMVVALAAHDSSAHVQALAALARAIADPTRLAKILKATSALEVADLLDEGTAT
ncbi:MAG: PTS sugar transporter subunit IIA [Candidatus Limnocylindrus sp.]|jgi:PTS system ascorbate-specific IIA component